MNAKKSGLQQLLFHSLYPQVAVISRKYSHGAFPIKIALADNDPIYREGLEKLLASYNDIHVLGTYSNGKDLITNIDLNELDIAVLDVDMPSKNGLETAIQLSKQKPEIKILFLTALHQKEYAYSSLGPNIFGMLTKTTSVSQLVTVIKQVFDGFTVMSAAPADVLSTSVVRSTTNFQDYLYFREKVDALPEHLKPVSMS